MPINYKDYPPTWKTEIVPAISERAKGCCETCGLQNGQMVWAVSFQIRDLNDGKYRSRSIWFRDINDALREASDDKIFTEIKVVLTVAHLDHDETNHEVSLDRLRALCQLCHLRYDAKEKYRRITEKWNNKKQTI